jgi:hypothetical protein
VSKNVRPSVETALAQVRRLYHPDSAEGVLVDAVERANEIVDAALAYRRIYRSGEHGATGARERLFRLLDRPVRSR